jgi:hypothetical protein
MSVKNSMISMCCVLVALAVPLACNISRAADLPPYLQELVGTTPPAPSEIATQNVLQLNTTMFDLYANAGAIFKKNILASHPVILALFSGAGGRFMLYRPGMAPIEAPPVPIAYQILKSVGHSTMALAEVVGPYLDNSADQSWLASMLAYRSRMQSALEGIDQTEMPAEWRNNSREILKANLAFMDACIAKHSVSFSALQSFAQKQQPLLKKNIAWAAQTQVAHWMNVVAGWKKSLGNDWNKTYAASNTIYVARQNNVIFSVLAQYFGPDAINDRLMLIETISFTTTPDEMLESMTRIIADRSVGAVFFGNYHLMDFELMGGDARAAIIAEDQKRGMTPVLPPLVPFGSHQWPMLITAGNGPGSLAQLQR